jgi:transcriptional regulator with XRE-family HTH domain
MSLTSRSDVHTETARRVRAARAYCGLTVREVADAVGLGLQTIKRIEAGSRVARKSEIVAIAEACGLPRDWFEADFEALVQLASEADELLARVDRRLARIERHVGLAPLAEDPQPSTKCPRVDSNHRHQV